jgi:hypothetical protein
MQHCPNCGAYVMGDDNICPRCYHPLDKAPARTRLNSEIFDVDDIEAAPAGEGEPAAVPEMTAETAGEAIVEDTGEGDPAAAPEMTAETAGEAIVEDTGEDTGEAEPAAAPEMTAETAGEAIVEDTGEAEPGDQSEAEESAAGEDHASVPAAHLPDAIPVFDRPRAVPPDDADRVESLEPAVPPDEAVEDVAEGVILPEPVEKPESAGPFEAASTQPRLHDVLPVEPPDVDADDDTSELPTVRLTPDERIPAGPIDVNETVRQHIRQNARPAYIVPPAPYTPPPVPAPPPPVRITPPPAPYGYGYTSPAVPSMPAAYLQQRVLAYRNAGYRLRVNSPYEATLSYGKGLGAAGWLLALLSIIGVFWYTLLLALGGFRRDVVDIVLESDGQIYEDGGGAAHVRHQRSRVGRRWAMFGVVIFAVSLLLAIVLGLVAGIVLSEDRFQAALREAYPAVTLFEEHFSRTEADPGDVDLAKDGAVAYAVVAGIAAVGLWGGATLFVIGTIHARAYRVHVPPLPGWG